MMEKTNRTIEKDARGDSGFLDDIVEGAAMRFSKVRTTPPRKREAATCVSTCSTMPTLP